MENSPQLEGAKLVKKWPENGKKKTENSLEHPFFLAMFCPCPAAGGFQFGFPFFSRLRLLAVFHAMPARHDCKVCETETHKVLAGTSALKSQYVGAEQKKAAEVEFRDVLFGVSD